MKMITARDNPTLKALRALCGDARRQREEGRTVLEGPHLVAAALAHRVMPELELDFATPTAWLFGNEGAGLRPELVAAAQRRATIPLAAGNESLNVAAAAAVCLFEMRRQRQMG